jgi:hypothetical protein
MGERRGHPVAAVGIGLLTLLGTAFLGACAALAVLGFAGDEGVANGHPEYLAGVIPFGLLAVACSYWGLIWARRVGRGCIRHEGDYAQERFPAALGPAWLVAEPGAEATRFIVGEERAGFLAAGVTVTEVRRTGSRVLVTGPDGLTGWVDADRLQPPGEGEGGG